MSRELLPLQSSITLSKSLPENTIDFSSFHGPSHEVQECMSTPPTQLSNNNTHLRFGFSYKPSSAIFIVVSASKRCSLVARIFCTKLVHYFRWCEESVMFYMAGPSERGVEVQRFEDEMVEWERSVRSCIASALEYFNSEPPVGFVAVPFAILQIDCESAEALKKFREVLDSHGSFLVRHVWFGEEWRDTTNLIGDYIDVCIRLPGFRATRCGGSVVCSKVTSYLTNCISMLHHLYINEPLDGSPEDTVHSISPIFFTRHGQSEYNLQDRLGGDPDLTESGRVDAADLAVFFHQQVRQNERLFTARNSQWDKEVGFEVWCSQLRRTRRTAEPVSEVLTNGVLKTFKSLNEIHAGICEDMTNEDVKALYPPIQSFRHTDKVGFRYPNGESYLDLARRLEPLLLDLESTRKCVLVVAHQAVLRTALSFFGGPSVYEAVHTPCPQRTIWCCTYNRLGEPRISAVSLWTRQDSLDVEETQWKGW